MQPNDMVGLYNADGIRVGTYCESTGRAQIGARFYAPERTCRKVIPNEMEGYVYCSECGAEIGEYVYPRFCHDCGSKVVG